MLKVALFSLILLGCTSYNPSHFNRYVDMAQQSYAIKDWNETVSIISLLEKNTHITDDLRLLKARSLRQINQAQSGFDYLNQAFTERPHSEILLLEIAQWHVDRGEVKEAKNLLMSLYSKGHPSESVRRLLGYVYMHLGEWSQAQLMLEQFSATSDEEAHFWLGQTHYKVGNYKAAANLFMKTFNGNLYKKRSAQYLAWIFIQLQDVDAANSYIRYLALENSQDMFVQKMNLRNILNMPKIDKVTTLKLYNDLYVDDWGQYKYFSEMKKAGFEKESLDYLNYVVAKNPASLWAVSHYANELYAKGDRKIAKNILENSLALLSENDAKLVRTQLVFLEKGAPAVFRAVANNGRYRIRPGDTLPLISIKFFNTQNRWKEILKLNSGLITNPDDLPVGIEIAIPEGP